MAEANITTVDHTLEGFTPSDSALIDDNNAPIPGLVTVERIVIPGATMARFITWMQRPESAEKTRWLEDRIFDEDGKKSMSFQTIGIDEFSCQARELLNSENPVATEFLTIALKAVERWMTKPHITHVWLGEFDELKR